MTSCFRAGRNVPTLFLAACGAVLLAAGVSAQEGAAGIVGHVVDESGAVLPGVTVTATSPALQVPNVVAVTDENGEYRMTRLPIGVYAVRYELSGFQAVQRDDVRLTVGFVATMDIKLGLGTLQETVTVSGASPVIDVTSVTPRTNFMRETLEELPTTRNSILSLTVQAPGIRTSASTFDVGGSQFTSAPSFNNFGRPGDNWEMIEGVVTTPVSGSGQGVYWDFAAVDEAALQTVGNGAEMPASGVYVNALLKSGGDQFHGNAYYATTGPWAQANNIDDRLAGFGITSGGDLQQRYDVNGDLDGHIIPKKLWFYGGGRRAWDDTTVLGAVKPDGSPASTLKGQGFWTAKVSYQLSPNHRLIAFDQWNWKYNVRLMEVLGAGDLAHIDVDAPSIELIESHIYYHTDHDRPAVVPAQGIEAVARSYAKIIDTVNTHDRPQLMAAPMTSSANGGR